VRVDRVAELADLAVDLANLRGEARHDLRLRAVRALARVEHERAEARELLGASALQSSQAPA
jgi:hypothetical protein